MVTIPIATKDSKVAHVISLALSVQQDFVDGAGGCQSQSLDDGINGKLTPMGRRRRVGFGHDGQHQLRQQRQTKSNEGPSSAPITPPEVQNGEATGSYYILAFSDGTERIVNSMKRSA
uniref:Uncharacterized protein n=1 Tax=Romanomermis culicivorax TaxID=13658 RepID=A0A915L1M4_ROMCU